MTARGPVFAIQERLAFQNREITADRRLGDAEGRGRGGNAHRALRAQRLKNGGEAIGASGDEAHIAGWMRGHDGQSLPRE